jgi:hypothetical protein
LSKSRGRSCAPRRPAYEYWGDGENVALVSSRVPPEAFLSECSEVFDFRHRRRVVRVLKASVLPAVASRLRPVGLRTYTRVDPSLKASRWLVWSVPCPDVDTDPGPASGATSVGRVCSLCRGAFTVIADGRVLTACPCGECWPF